MELRRFKIEKEERKITIVSKHRDLISVESKSGNISGKDRVTFTLGNINNWYVMNEKKTPNLNRWWTLLIIIGVWICSMTTYTYVKNNTIIESYETLWICFKYFCQGWFIFGMFLFVPWVLMDLMAGEPIAERMLRFILSRRLKTICFELKNRSVVKLPVRNKKESMKIIMFMDLKSK